MKERLLISFVLGAMSEVIVYVGKGFEIRESKLGDEEAELEIWFTHDVSQRSMDVFQQVPGFRYTVPRKKPETYQAYLDILKIVGAATVREEEERKAMLRTQTIENLTRFLYCAKTMRLAFEFKIHRRESDPRRPSFQGTSEVFGISTGSIYYASRHITFEIETSLFGALFVKYCRQGGKLVLVETYNGLDLTMDELPTDWTLALLATRQIATIIVDKNCGDDDEDDEVKALFAGVFGNFMLPVPYEKVEYNFQ